MVIAAEAAAPTDVGVVRTFSRPRGGRWHPNVVVAAAAAAVLPIFVAATRAVLRGWAPTGDESYSAIRAWDLFSLHPPTLGTWSSASQYTEHQINHPGALQFDLLAVPVRLLGHGPGTAIGLALINAAAVALAGWLVYRRLGAAPAALTYGFFALLTWSMGSEMLYAAWSQHSPLLPFALFLIAVWCAVAGDWVALPVMVVAGNFALQTHLSYAILVPGLLLFAITAVAWRVVRQRRDDPDGWPELRRRTLRWSAITVATQLVVGIQPLVEQIIAPGEGNLAALYRSSSAPSATPGMGATVRALGGTLVLPPAWLPPSFGSPAFDLRGLGPSTFWSVVGLAGLAAALAVLGWRAHKRGASAVATGALTALVILGLALLTIPRAPIRWGVVATYLRWMWPVGMVLWLLVAVAVLDELRARSNRPASYRWALPGLVIALVAACATLPKVDNGSASPEWTVEAFKAVEDDVRDAVDGSDPLLVQISPHVSSGAVGPPVLMVLQEAGVPFYVDDPALIRQLGRTRRFDLGDATTILRVDTGQIARARPGERLVASWSDLDDRELAELERLTDRVTDLVAAHGLELTPEGRDFLFKARDVRTLRRVANGAGDPDETVRSGVVRQLWAGSGTKVLEEPLLDTDVYPRDLMDRWAELVERHDERVLEVYMGRIQASRAHYADDERDSNATTFR